MNYQQKLEDLIQEGLLAIFYLIKTKKIQSRLSSGYCLPIKEESVCFNLEGNRYLSEIHEEHLIDDHGYTHNFFTLTSDELCQLIDHLIETYK